MPDPEGDEVLRLAAAAVVVDCFAVDGRLRCVAVCAGTDCSVRHELISHRTMIDFMSDYYRTTRQSSTVSSSPSSPACSARLMRRLSSNSAFTRTVRVPEAEKSLAYNRQ